MLEKSRMSFFHFIFAVLTTIIFAVLIKQNVDVYKMASYTKQTEAEVALLIKKTLKSPSAEHVKCLATNIYHEASGEPFMGKVAVARVVMNRIKHGFAPNPCRVIYQSRMIPDLDSPAGVKKACQFSWVCEGKTMPHRNENYKQAEEIAKQVLAENKWHEIIPSNTLFFHNKSVDPKWSYKKTMAIGNHIFYAKHEK